MNQGYIEGLEVQNYMKILWGPGPHRSRHLDLSRCSLHNDRLYYDNMIYVPHNSDLKLLLIKHCHDHASGGHHGQNKVFAEISRDY